MNTIPIENFMALYSMLPFIPTANTDCCFKNFALTAKLNHWLYLEFVHISQPKLPVLPVALRKSNDINIFGYRWCILIIWFILVVTVIFAKSFNLSLIKITHFWRNTSHKPCLTAGWKCGLHTKYFAKKKMRTLKELVHQKTIDRNSAVFWEKMIFEHYAKPSKIMVEKLIWR